MASDLTLAWSLSTSKTLLDHGPFPLKRHQVLCCEASPGHQAKGSGPFSRAGSNQALWDRPKALKIHRTASFQSMAHSTRSPPSYDPKALLSLHVLNKRKKMLWDPMLRIPQSLKGEGGAMMLNHNIQIHIYIYTYKHTYTYSQCQNYRTEPGVQKYGKIPYLCTPPGSDSARSREIKFL